MGKLETMRTSSSRREVRSENHRSTVGCMSGIFRFLSRHHNHSQKRLTSAKKKEKPTATITLTQPLPPPTVSSPAEVDPKKKEQQQPRSSCETPRSPTIPQEIRRPAAAASPDSPRRPAALVARLMGLENEPATTPPVAVMTTPEDRRRELLRALEKCDEDLKSLRRIIEAVRSSESQTKTASSPVASAAARSESDGEDSIKECNGGEQPSPVSVLDEISSPRYRSKRSPNAVGSRIVKPSRMGVLFAGDQDKSGARYDEHALSRYLLYRRIQAGAMPVPREFESRGRAIVEDFWMAVATAEGVRRQRWMRKRRRRSRAMGESVEEVWEEGVWEERWEAGRVGVRLEGDILRDMVEELVEELIGWNCRLSLLMGTCRKKLRF